MPEMTINLTDVAHGGLVMGRDKGGRAIFVPFAIPGETVRVRIPAGDQRFARAELIEVIKPAPSRLTPRCRHFGTCGLCHFQHITYEAQIRLKEAVVRDQLTRVGGIPNPPIKPIAPFPQAYEYRCDSALFPAPQGGLGYWSPIEHRIFPVEMCPILHPRLQELLTDLDIELPDLRKLTLRLGDDDEVLAALEVEDVEPPELAVDFPVSVAIVLPDRTAAALIGDPYLPVAIKETRFRVSPGVPCPSTPKAAEMIIEAVIEFAGLTRAETILQINGDFGWMTAALAERAAEVVVIEPNSDAVADMVENLDEFDNISIFEGTEESVLAGLEQNSNVVVVRQERSLSPIVAKWLARNRPRRLVLIAEAGLLAKDAPRLSKLGYRLQSAAPLDTEPQTYRIEVVSVWVSGR